MSSEQAQIKDNPALLKLLMNDLQAAPQNFRPTNYWQFYGNDIVNYLETTGLKNFRSYATNRLTSFSAATYHTIPFAQDYISSLRFKSISKFSFLATVYHCYTTLLGWLKKIHPACALFKTKPLLENKTTYLADCNDLKNVQYRYSQLLEQTNRLDILQHIEDSGIGAPHDLFVINGSAYTIPFLLYFDRMVYVASQIDLSQINTIMEIGSGYGGSAEVYLKSFSHLRYFNFDLPPQIYVAQQYLEAVFPGQVYGYDAYCDKVPMDPEKYRIFCLPTWTLEAIGDFHFDLLINTASFQEMEPDTVAHYYELIKNNIDYAYLFELTHGTYRKTSPNGGGTENPVILDDYYSIFSDFDTVASDNFSRIQHPYTHLLLKNNRLNTAPKREESPKMFSNRFDQLPDSIQKRFY